MVQYHTQQQKRGVSSVGNHSHQQHTLLTDYPTDSPYSESYRTLYANIRLHWHSNPESAMPTDVINHVPTEPTTAQCHTLLLTTPTTHIGHTTIAANLAIIAAQCGNPTILIDADLRTPTLQQRFGLSKNTGLSELLTEEAITPQKVASHLQATFVPHLQLLCAGTSTTPAAELLFSPKLPEILSSIRQLLLEAPETKTSIVIFNSPPVLGSADATLIGAHVEETFLTIAAGHTTRTQAKQAQEQLQRVHIKLTGIIVSQK